MSQPFIGTEALASGRLTRGELRGQFRRRYPRVYSANTALPQMLTNIEGVWLWSGRQGIIAGRAAALLHGCEYVDAGTPVEVIIDRWRQHPGIVVRRERIAADEIVERDGKLVTSPARTAFDIARHLPRDLAVAHLDALARVTAVTAQEIAEVAQRYPGARGSKRARVAVDLMDPGAQSPPETALRLLVVDGGYPRPQTQVRVSDGQQTAFLDMGWEDPRIGLDYDGDYHFTDRNSYVRGISRDEMISGEGWIDLHVVKEHSPGYTLRRLAKAWRERCGELPSSQRSRTHRNGEQRRPA